jgi:hypothetical protein
MTGVVLYSFASKRLGACTMKGKKMVVIDREVQHVYPDKWEELEAIDKEFNKVEAKYGLPPKKRYQMISGPGKSGTLIIERTWESMAVMEAAFERLMADPVYQALTQKPYSIIKDCRWELYTPLP